MNEAQANTLIGEIRSVKMLLILHLLKLGYRQTHIAAALGVSDATISRMLPKGLPKGAAKSELSID